MLFFVFPLTRFIFYLDQTEKCFPKQLLHTVLSFNSLITTLAFNHPKKTFIASYTISL